MFSLLPEYFVIIILTKSLSFIIKFSPRVQQAIENRHLVGNVRNEFVRDICAAIWYYTLYPTKMQREHVALKVVDAYPFLKDAIGNGLVSTLEESYLPDLDY